MALLPSGFEFGPITGYNWQVITGLKTIYFHILPQSLAMFLYQKGHQNLVKSVYQRTQLLSWEVIHLLELQFFFLSLWDYSSLLHLKPTVVETPNNLGQPSILPINFSHIFMNTSTHLKKNDFDMYLPPGL